MKLPEPTSLVICLVACLLGLGVVVVYSSDWASSASGGLGIRGGYPALLRHLLALLLGVGAMVGMALLDYRRLEPLGYILLGVAFLGLVVVLVPGVGNLHGGARRWIRFGPLGFQPSEFAKLAMVVFLAGWATRNQGRMHEFIRGFLIPMAIIFALTVLTVIEPDFGTATFLVALGLMILLVAGTRWVYIVMTVGACLPLLYGLIHLAPYRRARLLAFMDPWDDYSGAGYHIIQSWIALGSGGLVGRGLGEGHQKLLFLPECSGDFIFAVLGEELGFLGTTSLIVLFALLVWQGLRIALRAQSDGFGYILSLGITFMLGYQAAFNMAVVLGCVPTKGIALPLISSGGSSLLLSLTALGMLLSVARHSSQPEVDRGGWRPGARIKDYRLSAVGLPVPLRLRRTGRVD